MNVETRNTTSEKDSTGNTDGSNQEVIPIEKVDECSGLNNGQSKISQNVNTFHADDQYPIFGPTRSYEYVETSLEYDHISVNQITSVGNNNIKDLQTGDKFCRELINVIVKQEYPSNAKRAHNLKYFSNEFVVLDGVLYHWYTPRVKMPADVKMLDPDKMLLQLVVPKQLKHNVLRSYHDCLAGGGHAGIKRTWAALKIKYYWPQMYQEMNNYIRSCMNCQINKTDRKKSPAPLTTLPVANTFHRLHINILCSLPKTKEGYQYVLLVVDSFSKWVEEFPLKTQKASKIAKILFKEVFCRYGCPRIIVSNRGRNFMSKLISALCKMFQITRHHTSSYHPQTNSAVERTNSTLAQILRSYIGANQSDWVNLLPCALMSLRSKPCTESTGFSPYQLLFGKEMEIPIDTALVPKTSLPQSTQDYLSNLISRLKKVKNQAKEKQLEQQAKSKNRYDLKAKIPKFKVGDSVLLKREKFDTGMSSKLSQKWLGPYEIIELGPSFTYKIRHIETNKVHKSLVNAVRMKSFTENGNESETDESDSESDSENDTSVPNTDSQQNPNLTQNTTQNNEPNVENSTASNTSSSQSTTNNIPRQNQANKNSIANNPIVFDPTEFYKVIWAKRSGRTQWFQIKLKNNKNLWVKENLVPKEMRDRYLKTHTRMGKARKKKLPKYFVSSQNTQ